MPFIITYIFIEWGCYLAVVVESVARAVTSDTKGLQFESSHWRIFKEHLFKNGANLLSSITVLVTGFEPYLPLGPTFHWCLYLVVNQGE